MLLLTKAGRLSVVQHPVDTTSLVIYAQKREDADRVVAMLDEVGREHHEVKSCWDGDGDYRFQIVSFKTTAAEMVARLVTQIDYTDHLDLGPKPETRAKPE